MGTITIDGKTYKGNNISINDDQVIVDGKVVEDSGRDIQINVVGDVQKIEGGREITVQGTVGSIKTGSGDVYINGNIKSTVQTGSGDVHAVEIQGNVQTGSGDVECGTVKGNVSTKSGDITHG